MKTPSHWIGVACRTKGHGQTTLGPAVAVLDGEGRLAWHGIAPLVEVRHHLRLDSSWVFALLGGRAFEPAGLEWWPAVASERQHRSPHGETSPYQLGRIEGLLEGLVRALELTWVEVDRDHWLPGALGRRPKSAGDVPRLVLDAASERWPAISEMVRPHAKKDFPWPAKGQARAAAVAQAAWIAERARIAAAQRESA